MAELSGLRALRCVNSPEMLIVGPQVADFPVQIGDLCLDGPVVDFQTLQLLEDGTDVPISWLLLITKALVIKFFLLQPWSTIPWVLHI